MTLQRFSKPPNEIASDAKADTYGSPEEAPALTPDTSAEIPIDDAELQKVVIAWPKLPPVIRAGVLAMIQASAGEA